MDSSLPATMEARCRCAIREPSGVVVANAVVGGELHVMLEYDYEADARVVEAGK